MSPASAVVTSLAQRNADLAVLDDPVELRRFTRFDTGADGVRIADSSLRISGMYCATCASTIEQAVAAVVGVRQVSVSAAGERARVRWDPAHTRVAEVIGAIRKAGYDAIPDAALEAAEARRRERRAVIWRLFVAGFCAMQVMMLATPSYVASGHELEPDLRQLLNWGCWLLSLPVLVFAAGPYFRAAWRSVRARQIGMDVPVALGLAVTFIASSGATFDPGGAFGSEVYFDSLTMFVSFLLAARWLETRARHRVAETLETALAGMPQTALRLDANGQAEVVSVQHLAPGDVLRIPVGQAFAADGVLLQGATRADESLLTGESAAVDKPVGAHVVAGSINLGVPALMRVERIGADTRLEAIVALMRDAMSQRPELARAADRWAGVFLWAVLLLAAAAAAAWSIVDPSRAVWVAVSVLIVTCPCALSLAAPSALLAAASTLARNGVVLQRLDALEAMTRVQRVYLDKTGTVTDQRVRLRGVQRLADIGIDDVALRRIAASLAAWSTHPLSRALVESSAADGSAWQSLVEVPGQGLSAVAADGHAWRLGSARYVCVAEQGLDRVGGGDDAADPGPSVWLGRDGRAVARFDFDEVLRDDARATVDALRALGLEVVLLSGDRTARAEAMGAQLAVNATIGGATPESKLSEVAAAQSAGLRVAMVGDGINDAPVLARADVSVAMGQGALVARAQADAVIASNHLIDLLHLRRVAQQTMRIVRQNLVWAAAYNLTCIPLALLGWLPPWAAGLGMAASSLAVVGNALRLMRSG